MTATFEVAQGDLKYLTKYGNKRIDPECLEAFWDDTGFAKKRGVYLFGIRASRGWRPLYVGLTVDQTFRARVAQHVKYQKDFDEMLKGIKKGTPVLFLIGRVGKGRRSKEVIHTLETEVINYAFGRNPNLHNDRKIDEPIYIVKGFRRGRPSKAARDLRDMIGWG